MKDHPSTEFIPTYWRPGGQVENQENKKDTRLLCPLVK
jgi:hypothetical protein